MLLITVKIFSLALSPNLLIPRSLCQKPEKTNYALLVSQSVDPMVKLEGQ